MKQLTLHVGTHKTGTTSLQSFMLENADLLAKQGIYAPRTPSDYPHANKNRTACFLRYMARRNLNGRYPSKKFGRMVGKDEKAVRSALETHDDILLSDERIWYDAASRPKYWKEIKSVAEGLGFESFRIVVYLRKQDDLAVSLWEQLSKQPTMKLSFDDYLKSAPARNALNYLAVLSDIEETFGYANMIVRVYDRKTLVEGDICHDFCNAIGIEWDDDFALPQNLNNSLTFTAAEIKRIANSTPASMKTDNMFRSAALRVSEAAKTGKRGTLSSLSAEDYAAFLESCAEGNATVAQKYLGKEDGALFDRQASQPPSFETFTPEMLYDMCYFFSEAIAIEHNKNKRLKRQVAELENRLDYVENTSVSVRIGKIINWLRSSEWRAN